jgi:hypothetical protein
MTGSILGEGQTAYGTACDSDRTDKEDRRTWPQIIHGQFLSPLNYLMTWPRNIFTVVALTAPKTSKLKGRHSHKNQGCLDSNTVAGQERHLHVDKYSQCPSER